MAKEKYYMTTAIAYTSGKPHIGNTYEIVLADAIARYKNDGSTGRISRESFRKVVLLLIGSCFFAVGYY